MGDLTAALAPYGLPGVVILAMGWALKRLYDDNKQLQKDKDALQEARRMDAKETTDKVTQPLASLSQTVGLLYDKLKSSKEA